MRTPLRLVRGETAPPVRHVEKSHGLQELDALPGGRGRLLHARVSLVGRLLRSAVAFDDPEHLVQKLAVVSELDFGSVVRVQ